MSIPIRTLKSSQLTPYIPLFLSHLTESPRTSASWRGIVTSSSSYRNHQYFQSRKFSISTLSRIQVKPGKYGQPLSKTHPHLIQIDDLTPGIPAGEYEDRRRKLMKNLPEGAVVVCMGGTVRLMSQRRLSLLLFDVQSHQWVPRQLHRVQVSYVIAPLIPWVLPPDSVYVNLLFRSSLMGVESFQLLRTTFDSSPSHDIEHHRS
ncbi:hypothetical protein M231_07858 [Tremella mesenterica]|uniref:Uncharacterized protein n=1 Tax=Tremella mesenterica TaxID=5217 RepID=A0A4Q1BB26_TREME|nr:hypothetical protein M231_07858 [Tremella mesenterica]